MERHIKKVEEQITKLLGSILNDGQTFAEKYSSSDNLADISEIPIDDFQELLDMVKQRKAIVRMAPLSMSYEIFDLLATNLENLLLVISGYSIYVFPFAGIAMGYFFSWWFVLLGIVLAVVSSRAGKKVYSRVLFRRAFASETIFSFLFTGGKITLELPGVGILERIPE